jgi:hypothetical protein
LCKSVTAVLPNGYAGMLELLFLKKQHAYRCKLHVNTANLYMQLLCGHQSACSKQRLKTKSPLRTGGCRGYLLKEILALSARGK